MYPACTTAAEVTWFTVDFTVNIAAWSCINNLLGSPPKLDDAKVSARAQTRGYEVIYLTLQNHHHWWAAYIRPNSHTHTHREREGRCPAWEQRWHNLQRANLCKANSISLRCRLHRRLQCFLPLGLPSPCECTHLSYDYVHTHKYEALCKLLTDWLAKWRGRAEALPADGIFIDSF